METGSPRERDDPGIGKNTRQRLRGHPIIATKPFNRFFGNLVYIYVRIYINMESDVKEFLIVAGQRCIGHTDNKGDAMRMAIDHNRNRPAEWAHVVEVKK